MGVDVSSEYRHFLLTELPRSRTHHPSDDRASDFIDERRRGFAAPPQASSDHESNADTDDIRMS